MKNLRSRLMLMSIALIMVFSVFTGASEASPVKVKLNDSYVNMTSDPIIKNGRTLVPLRSIFEALGANVEWNNASKTVKSSLNGTDIVIKINSKKAIVNNKEVLLDVPGEIIGGSTYVPLRFIGESFGLKVGFTNGVVSINNKETKIDILPSH